MSKYMTKTRSNLTSISLLDTPRLFSRKNLSDSTVIQYYVIIWYPRVFLSTPNSEDTLSYSSEFDFESEDESKIGQAYQENDFQKCRGNDDMSMEIILEDNSWYEHKI